MDGILFNRKSGERWFFMKKDTYPKVCVSINVSIMKKDEKEVLS